MNKQLRQMLDISEIQSYIKAYPELSISGIALLPCIFYIFNKKRRHKKKHYGFDLISGMDELKKKIYQEVIFPFHNKDKYKKFNLTLPNGIIFYGPPGCGKTFFVERLAEELNMNYLKITHADIASPYIHQSVSLIADMFKEAKAQAPCLLFIDEIESLVPSRTEIGQDATYKHEEVDEFLTHLNNAAKDDILVIGATNHLDMIDSAVQRSGRFDLKIYVGPPDMKARAEMFRDAIKDIPHYKNIDYDQLACLTDNYTCADIVNIVQSAARNTVLNNRKKISQETLEQTVYSIPSSLHMDEVINTTDINFDEGNL